MRLVSRALAPIVVLAACRPSLASAPARAPEPAATVVAPAAPPAPLLAQAEAALAEGRDAQAAAAFARHLAGAPTDPAEIAQAHLGLATAYERLRNCPAAIRALAAFVERFPTATEVPDAWSRRGACEAELEQWEASAASFARAAAAPGRLPSARVEALAREGFALFQLDRFADADARLVEADAVFARARNDASERFATFYFVGMARFYRAAILHRRFRDVAIRLPEKRMAEDFRRKLDLLVATQDAYNHTISAKHVFWVSASGFWLGSLFEEFYDALMYAPVPAWLDERQRRVYYEELKKQIRPVVNKALWVFEKNLETARRLGYDNPFVERTEKKLAELQAVLLAGDARWGRPHARLVPEAVPSLEVGELPAEDAPAVDRKLFVPPSAIL